MSSPSPRQVIAPPPQPPLPRRAGRLSAAQWCQWLQYYQTPDFIETDPIRYPHRFQRAGADEACVELVAFLAAMFSYGNRQAFFGVLDTLFDRLGEDPLACLLDSTPSALSQRCQGVYYRFYTESDLAQVLWALRHVYLVYGSLKACWQQVVDNDSTDLSHQLCQFRQALLQPLQHAAMPSNGLRFFLADPAKGGTAKRWMMWLRWMVRHDAIDLGLWHDVMTPDRLAMPVDVHVLRTARYCRITTLKSPSWKLVQAITAYFRALNPADPVVYDFALFGLGQALAGADGPYPDKD